VILKVGRDLLNLEDLANLYYYSIELIKLLKRTSEGLAFYLWRFYI